MRVPTYKLTDELNRLRSMTYSKEQDQKRWPILIYQKSTQLSTGAHERRPLKEDRAILHYPKEGICCLSLSTRVQQPV